MEETSWKLPEHNIHKIYTALVYTWFIMLRLRVL